VGTSVVTVAAHGLDSSNCFMSPNKVTCCTTHLRSFFLLGGASSSMAAGLPEKKQQNINIYFY
jgi:hypothetical protein